MRSSDNNGLGCHTQDAEPAHAADRSTASLRAAIARPLMGISFGVSTQVRRWSILLYMKIATGKVVDGKVVVEGAEFEEGSSVTVMARDDEGGITLTPEEEAE